MSLRTLRARARRLLERLAPILPPPTWLLSGTEAGLIATPLLERFVSTLKSTNRNPTATMATEQDTKASFLERVKSFFDDVVTLDVLTLTGNISFDTDSYDQTKKAFKWDELVKFVAEGMKPASTAKLEVVAYTHAEWDLDSVNFVRKETGDGDKALVAAHQAAVDAAQKSRFEALKMMGNLIGFKG